jgi:hypothetical protein
VRRKSPSARTLPEEEQVVASEEDAANSSPEGTDN